MNYFLLKEKRKMGVVNYLRRILSSYLVLILGFSTVHVQEYTTDLQKTVVKITSSSDHEEQIGTGFVFFIKQSKAFVLTANHVVTDKDGFNLDSIVIEFEGDLLQYPADVFQAYETFDIAILLLNRFPENIGILELASSADVQDAEIYIYGYPGGGIAQKDVGGIRSKTGNRIFLDDISPNEGNSGGPLLTVNSNEVIGIILQRSASVEDQYALEIDQLKLLLKNEIIFKDYLGGAKQIPQREIERLLEGYKQSFENENDVELETVYNEDRKIWSPFFKTVDNIRFRLDKQNSEITTANVKVFLVFRLRYEQAGLQTVTPAIRRAWTLKERGDKWVIISIKK